MKNIIICLSILFFSVCSARNPIESDINFWLRQFKEHAEFATDFAYDNNLKQQGRELISRVSRLINQSISSQDFDVLAKDMKSYQHAVAKDVKNNGKDPIKLDLLDHMNKETDYARKKAQGKKLTRQEEAKFWSEEHQGQAKVMGKLIKAEKAPKLKEEAKITEEQLENNIGYFKQSNINIVESANNILNQIGKQLDLDPSKAPQIPKKLAEHEKREREYAQKIFKEFNNLPESPMNPQE